ncbi:PAS-domain containing protein [Azospirillum sp.]|uniref:PAS-domain containing protein n=1 Tax=Azospirillum sp. TaxID=34012 RepID=UPI00262ED982|nr:PAS-domain containing protein [Azospirillum sp.]
MTDDSQNRLSVLLEHMDQGVIMVAADLTVLAINGPLLELYGVPPDDATFGSFVDFVRCLAARGEFGPGDSAAILAEQLELARCAEHARHEHRRPNGQILEIRTRALPDGGFVRTHIDITERKRGEDELADKRETLRLILDNIGQGFILYDRDLRCITHNKRLLELTGIPIEVAANFTTMEESTRYQLQNGLLGLPADAPDFGDDIEAKLNYVIERTGRPNKECVYVRPQHDGRVLEVRVVPQPDGGQLRTFTDITRWVVADQTARQNREILIGVIDSMPALIDVRDRNGVILLTNRHFREIHGTSPTVPDRGPAADRAESLNRLVIESGQGVPFFEESGLDAAGRRCDWLTTKMPLTDDAGEVTHIVTVALDITARKRAEEELRDAQASLIQAEKMASLAQLVAGVAHEVNTPIGVTLTAISHLDEEVAKIRALFDSNRVKRSDFQSFLDVAWETTRMILSNIERAANLIQSFKQVAVDQASGERRVFDLAAYVDEVLLSLRPRLRKTRVVVETDIPPGLEIDGHPGSFAQVLSNLVINALVHAYDEGQEGLIRLTAEEAPTGWVTMRYSDDGKGIPPDIRNRVFDPFFTTKRGLGASGLGLSICANIMTTTMRGSIALDSAGGPGIRFLLRFPMRVKNA